MIKMLIFWIALLVCFSTSALEKLSKHIRVENLSDSIFNEGKKMARHLPTSQSYSLVNWSDYGDSLLFYRGGNLYRSKGAKSKFTKILDFKSVPISGAKPAIVCDKPGFVFSADKDNDEYSVVYAGNSETLTPLRLSKGKARNIGITVSDDKRSIAYASAEKGTGQWRLFSQLICGGKSPRTLYKGDRPVYPADFKPQGTTLLTTAPTPDGFQLSEWDLVTGKEKVLLHADTRIGNARYSNDGNYVFFVNSDNAEYRELYRLDRKSAEIEAILPSFGADVDFFTLSGDRSHMAISINREGLSFIMVIDAAQLKLISGLSKKPLGVVSRMKFSANGKKLAITLSQPAVPPRSGVYDYKNDKFIPWTGGFKNKQNVRVIPKITRYPTFDKVDGKPRQIPLLLYKPSTASASNPVPVIISAHGGPASQARPGFSRSFHYYVSKLGVAVLRPNIRGSKGYGRSFEQLDQVYKRFDSIKDIGALLDWVKTQPDLDSDKVLIMGGSYGGYVSIASLIAYPQDLVGAISRVGITDFSTFLQNTEPYRVKNRRKEYGDERDPKVAAYFKQISPLQHIDKIVKPILIIQGEKDPRVPAQQANDLVAKVKQAGVEVSYLLAKNEGHSFSKSKNRLARRGAELEFIKRLFKLNN